MIGKLWTEFKAFAFKGNMIDLAVAFVIGGAFQKIVTALVNDIIMPIVGYATSLLHIPSDYAKWQLGNFKVGDLLSEIVQFLIIALSVFIVIVKVVGTIMQKAAAQAAAAPAEPTTKECPMCLQVIPIKAKRCAFCTSDLASA